jgi:very-short-patch-repair endonuclease
MQDRNAKVRVGTLATRQHGRVGWFQLRALGISKGTISTWLRQGFLIPGLPRVYAVGHCAPCVEADLMAALLYAGPGAMLSHAILAWWFGLLDERPPVIDISTPRRCRSLPGIRVHAQRSCERFWHRGLPVTTREQAVLDVAATMPLRTVRLVLARLDYQERLNLPAIEAVLGRGRPGSTRLRKALERHQPDLARTDSRFEILFIERCEQDGIQLPETNQRIDGWKIDALWRDQRVAVELDGCRNHKSPAQVRLDRRKDLHLRSIGLSPLRYTEDQLEHDWPGVRADLRRAGAPIPPGRSDARGSR